MKLKVIKLKDDDANRLCIGDIIEFTQVESMEDFLLYHSDIVNIGGAHYSFEELDEYFQEIL